MSNQIKLKTLPPRSGFVSIEKKDDCYTVKCDFCRTDFPEEHDERYVNDVIYADATYIKRLTGFDIAKHVWR